jgi:D-alanine-D-alanine ligase
MKDAGSGFGKVGVLMGGRSSEREISLMSGTAVLEALKSLGVDAHGFDPGRQSLAELEQARFDRVFIALHGRFGEDGTMQGVLETLRVPYTGSGVQASAVAIDKLATKRLWAWSGVPTPRWVELDARTEWAAVAAQFAAGLVVKPRSEGSTIGITKLAQPGADSLRQAWLEASRLDPGVFAEEMVIGRELTCAILGEGETARALPLIEIRAPQANYDYHSKYFSDETRYLCPAPVDAALACRVSAICVQAYRAVGARGWGRVDVMLREGAGGALEPQLLEVNTSPGMTGHSLVPMAARETGMDFGALVLHILSEARLEIAG